jgi:RNA polymerase sigma-70 factor (sigma-E family)
VGFDDEFDAMYSVACQVAYRILGSRPDAEDVAQEALVKAYVAWHRIESHARPWVATVAAGAAIDRWRRLQRAVPADTVTAADGPDTAIVDRLILREALQRLPRRQRDAVVMRYLADLPEADVAHAMGCSTGTVKQHASRGLAALRVQLLPVEPITGSE